MWQGQTERDGPVLNEMRSNGVNTQDGDKMAVVQITPMYAIVSYSQDGGAE